MLFIRYGRSEEISSAEEKDPNVPHPRKNLEKKYLEYEVKVVFSIAKFYQVSELLASGVCHCELITS